MEVIGQENILNPAVDNYLIEEWLPISYCLLGSSLMDVEMA